LAPEPDVIVIMLAKGNSNARSAFADDEFKVTVIAGTPDKSAGFLKEFRRAFLPSKSHNGPVFFIMNGRRPEPAALEEKHKLDDAQLLLHYGDDFKEWVANFTETLNEPGISILRGDPGTGKTSFLRHIMCALADTHRFYFLPVDNFGLLGTGSLTDFWKTEQREHSAAHIVLVLEDAETLLLERDHESRSPVAAILNLTDGLMTEFIRVHLVCTLNCKMDDLDPALIRPGRLQTFKSFDRVPRERALKIASHHGFVLPDQQDYSLAEIFASSSHSKMTSGVVKEKGPVGFSTHRR
jgi:hypothetical protein